MSVWTAPGDTLQQRLEAAALPADTVIDAVAGWLHDLALTECESCIHGRCVDGSRHLAYLYASQIIAEGQARADARTATLADA